MILDFRKLAYLSMRALSFVLFLFVIFVVYSFIETIFYIRSAGGLFALNYPDVTGHLVILFMALACLYLTVKITRKMKG